MGLEQLAALVHRESGIVLREPQFGSLAAAVKRVDCTGDPDHFMRLAADPHVGRAHIARLLDEVSVNETFFMREHQQLEQIDWLGLFDRARKTGKCARIWSVGCATGEEAYSLALLACEEYGGPEPPVMILATDISETALGRAREGCYRERSTRGLDSSLLRRYFREEGAELRVSDRLRSLVTFARHNLVADPVPPPGQTPFDLILCRNVLIYFDNDTADRVMAALDDALAPAGMVILGSADALYRGGGRLRELVTAEVPRRRPTHPKRTARQRAVLQPPVEVSAPAPAPDPASVAEALAASRFDDVISSTARLLAADPLSAWAHFLQGLAKLETGEADAAVVALRRALYAEPRLGLAAFQLGRAYESLGNAPAARRSYERALKTCEQDCELHEPLLDQVDMGDVIAAARARLAAIESNDGISR